MTDNLPEKLATSSQILLYQTEDGHSRIEVRLENETVWLSQKLLAELFQVTVPTINEHIKNIFNERELQENSVIRKFRITAADGKSYLTNFYNLDVIIAVGYRIRSYRGTQFRKWATERLREYIVKGFTLDDERLQEPGGLDYFDELLERIRAIRASEKRFYQKIRDIYATSIDYNSNHPMSREFFATVQNILHYAITGHTAAELIAERSDATKPYMGLTSWKGSGRGRQFTKTDIMVAKNYLSEEELSTLNLVVSQYLDFAELQARGRKPMYMADWKAKLDAFLTLNDQDILTDAGRVSAQLAKELAESEFEKYQTRQRQIEADTANEELNRTVKRILQNEREENE